ncbi:circadian clock protein LdpA [Cyanobacterium aponinum]|uniref:circadian clock protein LdpA n=1 Tax=Cyanobacterium aponinum TaxID=379064 RepID=UPI000C12C63D|nr:LdpA C-terminal domain-containing domain [Cyanobacterium aponinum]PHV61889.1 4Fe-4S ferredoxin [Cyanobacterium aponinum IPPAS B-1201]
MSYSPFYSLQEGNWFKLICGASYQHLPSIRNLALIYTLAGADCIDMAADRAVIHSALEGIKKAQDLFVEAKNQGYDSHFSPFVMVSINDGEDPHFRKAYFNPNLCPTDCPRPCESICPADAITFSSIYRGVKSDLCYGCGRCLPICPLNLIQTESIFITIDTIVEWLDILPIDAIEIHTQEGHFSQFISVWKKLQPHLSKLKIIAISCPYTSNIMDYLQKISDFISPLEIPLIWQTDGRPMSGDIGEGTTHLTIKYAQKLMNRNLKGFIQLAGGTNEYTIKKLSELNLTSKVAGIAFGSKGRKIIADVLQELENISTTNQIENYPDLLWKGVEIASSLVSPLKLASVS